MLRNASFANVFEPYFSLLHICCLLYILSRIALTQTHLVYIRTPMIPTGVAFSA